MAFWIGKILLKYKVRRIAREKQADERAKDDTRYTRNEVK
jgi:hypothetical protein